MEMQLREQALNCTVEKIEGALAEKEWERLLNASFRVPDGQGFFDDFPIWREASGVPLFRLGVRQAGRPGWVAAAGARLAEVRVANDWVTAGIIGGVVTDPSCRGRGFASQLVNWVGDWAQNRGARLLLLWTGEEGLYRKLGFHPCGTQYRIPLDGLVSGIFQVPGRIQEGWVAGLERLLYSRRPAGVRLTRMDAKWLAAHRNVRWFWCGDPQAPLAYAAVGRGIDLAGCVHEWGGEKTALLGLLSRVAALVPGAQLLTSAEGAGQLGLIHDEIYSEPLVFAKILDRDFFQFHARAPMSDSLSLEQAVFGGRGAKPTLPLWLWGLDGA